MVTYKADSGQIPAVFSPESGGRRYFLNIVFQTNLAALSDMRKYLK